MNNTFLNKFLYVFHITELQVCIHIFSNVFRTIGSRVVNYMKLISGTISHPYKLARQKELHQTTEAEKMHWLNGVASEQHVGRQCRYFTQNNQKKWHLLDCTHEPSDLQSALEHCIF